MIVPTGQELGIGVGLFHGVGNWKLKITLVPAFFAFMYIDARNWHCCGEIVVL
jgi:hypothetical protein